MIETKVTADTKISDWMRDEADRWKGIKGDREEYSSAVHQMADYVLAKENEIAELKSILLSSLGAFEAMIPFADKFLSGIDRDLHKELPGLKSIISEIRKAANG